MKGEELPPDDHVLRHCGKFDLISEADGEIQRVAPSAFEPDADGISVTWVEYFAGLRSTQVAEARYAMARGRKLRKSHRLAMLNVGSIVEAGRNLNVPTRVVHDPILEPPEKDNSAHSLIKGVPADNHDLQNRLAHLVISLEVAKE